MNTITEFRGQYEFLSNFFVTPVFYQGMEYPSAENAFQAAKSHDEINRIPFTSCTPRKAKKMGHMVHIRSDWEHEKLEVLKEILCSKFANPSLRKALVNTSTAVLIEGNLWHDNYYGNCKCPKCAKTPGQNHLGWLLMEIRGELARLESLKRQSRAELQKTYWECRLEPDDRLTLHLEWEDLEDALSHLLTKLLLRDVRVQVKREDYFFWYARMNNEPISVEEMQFLIGILGDEPGYQEGVELEEETRELYQGFCNKLLSTIMPFPLCCSNADNEGVCFTSNVETKETLLRVVISFPMPDVPPVMMEMRARGEVNMQVAFRCFSKE